MNTLREKEIILVASSFSFPLNDYRSRSIIVNLSIKIPPFLSHLKDLDLDLHVSYIFIVVSELFQFQAVQNLSTDDIWF